jgi:hypothetical protein
MSTTRKELAFKAFNGIADSSDNQAIVTVTYNVDNFTMNLVMENTLIRVYEDNALHLENCNGTELIIKIDAINSTINEGFDPLIERNVFRMELVNRMVLHISFKCELITTKLKENL